MGAFRGDTQGQFQTVRLSLMLQCLPVYPGRRRGRRSEAQGGGQGEASQRPRLSRVSAAGKGTLPQSASERSAVRTQDSFLQPRRGCCTAEQIHSWRRGRGQSDNRLSQNWAQGSLSSSYFADWRCCAGAAVERRRSSLAVREGHATWARAARNGNRAVGSLIFICGRPRSLGELFQIPVGAWHGGQGNAALEARLVCRCDKAAYSQRAMGFEGSAENREV